MDFKKYLAQQLVGKTLRFECDCIIKLDCIGTIIDYSISNNEIQFNVKTKDRTIVIGENHPNLKVTPM